MGCFEDLAIWSDARRLSFIVFRTMHSSTSNVDFRFRSQILSSAGSVMDNIAEGYERNGNQELLQFLSIAKGSCGETRSQIYRAFDFGYINEDQMKTLLDLTRKISSQISSLQTYLRKSDLKGAKYK
ncbi:MAG TPA: four helix bundle protein [Bacteroidales bacterium]|nr:four helix bundle protein [Bacteroidales bacterium]HRZ48091.1 four helix bundle protein [Bacteroidales bacterium]